MTRTLPLLLALCFGIALVGCGDTKSTGAEDKAPQTGGQTTASTGKDCPDDVVRDGITFRTECGPAKVKLKRKGASVDLQGRCATGPKWFELVAGETVIDGGGSTAPRAKKLPDRVVLTVGQRTPVAGSALKPAPKDGTYSPVALVGSINGHAFNAFKSAVGVLQGGRTEGRVDAVEADGTKVTLTFTCRRLPSS